MDGDWWHGRSKDDEIVVRLIAKDEEEKDNTLALINSTTFISNMNSEINKIEEFSVGKSTFWKSILFEGQVTAKSISEPVAKVLTGI